MAVQRGVALGAARVHGNLPSGCGPGRSSALCAAPARGPAAGRRKDDGRGRAWLAYGVGPAYLLDMMTFAQIVRFRIYAGSLLTRPLPRAEAGNC